MRNSLRVEWERSFTEGSAIASGCWTGLTADV